MARWMSLGPTDDLPPCVFPLDDACEHAPDDVCCWCDPFFDNGILIHNSLDCREVFEPGGLLNQ